MKFIVDRYIPFVEGVLEPYGEVEYLTPGEITAWAVRDADALLVRTRTKVDAGLLSGSRCSFVGTATIGMDHIDAEWCAYAGIEAVNAPGCNAPAVAQYVLSAIGRLTGGHPEGKRLGVVGVGHVGSIVGRWAKAVGMEVMEVDPPRRLAEGGSHWSTLEEVASKADIVTFHVPLVRKGDHPTFHLADERFLQSLRPGTVLINSSRGPVVDNAAWLRAIRRGALAASVIDVWEGEPLVDKELMEAADISTPHIAGYSIDGKIRATQMVLDSLSRHFGLPPLRAASRRAIEVPGVITVGQAVDSYDPGADTARMRRCLRSLTDEKELRVAFENLRDFYDLRQEIAAN